MVKLIANVDVFNSGLQLPFGSADYVGSKYCPYSGKSLVQYGKAVFAKLCRFHTLKTNMGLVATKINDGIWKNGNAGGVHRHPVERNARGTARADQQLIDLACILDIPGCTAEFAILVDDICSAGIPATLLIGNGQTGGLPLGNFS